MNLSHGYFQAILIQVLSFQSESDCYFHIQYLDETMITVEEIGVKTSEIEMHMKWNRRMDFLSI